MSYKLIFFNLRRIREYFKSFKLENLATKSISQKIIIKRKYRQIMLSTAKINLRKKTEVLLNRQSKRTLNVIKT